MVGETYGFGGVKWVEGKAMIGNVNLKRNQFTWWCDFPQCPRVGMIYTNGRVWGFAVQVSRMPKPWRN